MRWAGAELWPSSIAKHLCFSFFLFVMCKYMVLRF